MKLIKTISVLALSVVILTSFTHCKSSKEVKSMDKTEHNEHANHDHANHSEETEHVQVPQGRGKQMPLFIRDTYFQRWVAGEQAGGSGIHIYFPTLINKYNYKLEKVYFRGMIGDMQSNETSHFANLKSSKDGLVMSNGDNAEYANTIPTKESFPFELKPNECMISYIDKGETKYFQVYNIVKKASVNYPSASPKKN